MSTITNHTFTDEHFIVINCDFDSMLEAYETTREALSQEFKVNLDTEEQAMQEVLIVSGEQADILNFIAKRYFFEM